MNIYVRSGPVAQGTDQEKLLAHLEEELEQSRDLIRAQQQLLQVRHQSCRHVRRCVYDSSWKSFLSGQCNSAPPRCADGLLLSGGVGAATGPLGGV